MLWHVVDRRRRCMVLVVVVAVDSVSERVAVDGTAAEDCKPCSTSIANATNGYIDSWS